MDKVPRYMPYKEPDSKIDLFINRKSKCKFRRITNGAYGQFQCLSFNVHREVSLLNDKNFRVVKMKGKTVKDITKQLLNKN